MKYFILNLLFSLVFLVPSAHGQQYRGFQNPEQRLAQFLATLKDRLVLSDVQSDTIGKILVKHGHKMQSIRDSLADYPMDSIRPILKVIEDDRNNEIKTFLTNDQYTSFLQVIEEQRNRRRERQMEKK